MYQTESLRICLNNLVPEAGDGNVVGLADQIDRFHDIVRHFSPEAPSD